MSNNIDSENRAHNVATVYNVGRIKKEALPSAKIIAVVGSKALGSTSNNNVSQNEPVVNNNSMQEAAENSQENISKQKNNGNKYSLSVENENEGLYNDEEDNSISEEESYALINYKSSESYKINAKLREGEELSDSDIELINNLDNALSKLPVYSGEVYRNIVFDDFGGKEAFDAFLLEHEEGNIIRYRAYTSASTREDGYEVEGTYTVKMIINSINARDVDGFGNNFESEAIFPRKSKFVVDKVVYDSNGQPIIYLTEVTNNGKGNNGQLHSKKHGKAVQPMQESHSRNGNLQSVSSNDSRRDFGRNGLQGVSTERITSDSKNQYSIPTTAEELLDRYESGEISRDEFMSEVDELYTQSVNDFGDNKNNGNKYSISANNGIGIVRYNEKQYNDFGWVRYNDVLTTVEYNTLLSRYADFKHNKDKYPVTRWGEAVIYSTECPDVIMYVRGPIRSPEITKIVRVDAGNSIEATIIKEGVIENERDKISLPYKPLEDAFGKEIFIISKKRDFASFQRYKSETEGRSSQKDDSNSGTEQIRKGNYDKGNESNSRTFEQIGSEKNSSVKYSIPTTAEELLDRYESGEISRDEFMSEVDELYTQSVNDFGHLRKGERPKNAIKVPQRVEKDKKTHRFVRTIIEQAMRIFSSLFILFSFQINLTSNGDRCLLVVLVKRVISKHLTSFGKGNFIGGFT